MRDEDLLSRSVSEPSIFEALVPVHSVALHAYLARRAGRREADDLLSEVWLAAFAARSTFDRSRGTARPWLFGVARNVLLAHLRRRPREAAPSTDQPSSDDGWDAVHARLVADAARPALRRALTSLAPSDREVLLLVAWDELSPTEAAGVLGIPAGTARSRLHRAREQLRVQLEGLAKEMMT